MARDIEQVLREAHQALRDEGIDAWLERWCTEDIVWVGFEAFHGREAVAARMHQWIDQYEQWTFELEEVSDCGNGHGFLVMHQTGSLPGVGAAIDQRTAQVIAVRGERLAHIVVYLDIEAARTDAAAGTPGANQA